RERCPSWCLPQPLRILLLVEAQIFAAADAGHPVLVGEVPVDDRRQRGHQLVARRPAEFAADSAAVDCVASVVTRTILDVPDQAACRAWRLPEALGNQIADRVDYLLVRMLLPAADAIGRTDRPPFEHCEQRIA